LADRLAARLNAKRVRTKDVLINEYGAAPQVRRHRKELQDLGEQLDEETGGRWVAEAVRREARRAGASQPIVVDSARIPAQVALLRSAPSFRVVPIYVTASLRTLEARYAASASGAEEMATYAAVRESDTEKKIGRMKHGTWIRINTTRLGPRSATFLALAAIAAAKGWTLLPDVVRAFALGALPAGALVAPIAWFSLSWVEATGLVLAHAVLTAVSFVVFATLIGSAITQLSPIEHDSRPDQSGRRATASRSSSS
jgi:hypothetical protein